MKLQFCHLVTFKGAGLIFQLFFFFKLSNFGIKRKLTFFS